MYSIMEILKKKRSNRWGPAKTMKATEENSLVDSTCGPEMLSLFSETPSPNSANTRIDDDNESAPSFLIRPAAKKQKIVFNKSISSISLVDIETVKESSPQNGIAAGEASLSGEVDANGYYNGKISEKINSKYTIMSILGKGMFASVYRCVETGEGSPEEVAIKMIRVGDAPRKCGETELKILQMLNNFIDPTNSDRRVPVVIVKEHFEWKSLTCIVLENMDCNLRQVMKTKFPMGIPITTIQLLSRQLMEGLRALHSFGYVHCDIKPDNLLVDSCLTTLKICDFGASLTAFELSNLELQKPLVAKFYRSPELLVGLQRPVVKYAYGVDIWSAGVTLLEMCRSSVAFQGATDADVLWDIMQTLCPIPKCVLAAAATAAIPTIESATDIDVFRPVIKSDGSGWFVLQKRVITGPDSSGQVDETVSTSIFEELLPIPRTPSRPLIDLIYPPKSTPKSRDSEKSEKVFQSQQHERLQQLLQSGLLHWDITRRCSASAALNLPFFQQR